MDQTDAASATSSDQDHVALLWTGGWDSTFQLLQLLLVERCRVAPYYLIDAERPSTGVELRTMKRIKDHLFKEYPHTGPLLEPTRYFAVADIAPDAELTATFRSLLEKKFLGSQYDWLARFCKAHGIHDMQLCIHRDDKAHAVIERLVVEYPLGSQTIWRIDPQFQSTEEYSLFHFFSFPILNVSKTQMLATAQREGWEPVMNRTWFCHTPSSGMKPCGRCNPCRYTIEEGLGWRIPFRSRVSARVHHWLLDPLRSSAKATLRALGLRKPTHKQN